MVGFRKVVGWFLSKAEGMGEKGKPARAMFAMLGLARASSVSPFPGFHSLLQGPGNPFVVEAQRSVLAHKAHTSIRRVSGLDTRLSHLHPSTRKTIEAH